MTIMSAAEHRRAEDIKLASEQVADHVNPDARAEAVVMDLEGTEAEPTTIDDPMWQARQVADDVAADAEDWAGCYTDSASLAESVGREFGDQAFEAVMAGLRGSPCIEIPEGE